MERSISIDSLRCVLAFFIIVIHTLDTSTEAKYILVIARTAVPMFFILSGYFIYDVSKYKIKKRIKKTFNLMIIANIFFAIWSIFVNYHNLRYDFISETFNMKNIINFLVFNNSIYRGHLWFIGALLYCHILYFLEKS